jgi:hypothetical protein
MPAVRQRLREVKAVHGRAKGMIAGDDLHRGSRGKESNIFAVRLMHGKRGGQSPGRAAGAQAERQEPPRSFVRSTRFGRRAGWLLP